MTTDVFVAGKDYNDRVRYLHYAEGRNKVTTVDIPSGAGLVSDLLEQLDACSGTLCADSTKSIAANFIKYDKAVAVKMALEVDEYAEQRYRIKSRLRLESNALVTKPGQIKSTTEKESEKSDTADKEAQPSIITGKKIKQGSLLALVSHHDTETVEVDPWYRIFRRAGDSITPSEDVLSKLYEYPIPTSETMCTAAGWQPIAVVIDAEYLRSQDVQISRHLSWAQTTEDLIRNFVLAETTNEKLQALKQTTHLIVRFDCDGVIHVDRTSENDTLATLYVQQSENSEGDYIQSTPGRTPAIAAGFLAGLLKKLTESNVGYEEAIQRGLLTSQRAASATIQLTKGISHGCYLLSSAEGLKAEAKGIPVPFSQIEKESVYRWSILQTVLESKDQQLRTETKKLADEIVIKGSNKALANIPTARFGKLLTADRQEKESFRAIANLVTEYLRSLQAKPISIGVFGAPGSGKSFGIKEVVKTVADRSRNGGKCISKPLTFNLSQFRDYHDLVVAFHTIRDHGLSNQIPLVLFDEFDSSFEKTNLGWLQYLLAPMQDGTFLENGHERPIGPAIFVFIGGTHHTFEGFTADLHTQAAKDAKKPDFVSRLRGFVNIQGSHQSPRDTDYMYLIRRAIHLRAMLQMRFDYKEDAEINLDQGVLNALLTVPQFHHGARSLESIIAMSQLNGQRVLRRSALPSETQLGLHVDYKTFVDCFEPNNYRAIARVKIAEKILPSNSQANVTNDLRQRIAGQILDMIYNNGAYLVPDPPDSPGLTPDEDEEPTELVLRLAKYRYYAVNAHDSMVWDNAGENKQEHINAIKELLTLLRGCGFKVSERTC
ncbi:hypothetical protein BDV26DRAFT_287858 [Aspergillus bertholletiae]|uniref:ATPase AAA-type core domain-containing protein n=1 Tax=Aspergillus bertholletiae TaxID=1226010 RepID=A0A5N7BMM3_9EURO|nr:hypothetical protein BDV26DRAFT_287858 [Aspergillus bertholletiae]